ncbi:hypothetical protein HIM_09760 [Hirsutella minnesotensis 3608]|uniref:Tc1-like transposase DDE domain-containing protein n=1 Tax=Hirsutella minnesotensis 3608 TaxID=1043627 RepID=A0A0F7ZGG4_9HYPO|nr:hypothetical protein HIM_09760 [Hirsutella minnesotensis 3608]
MTRTKDISFDTSRKTLSSRTRSSFKKQAYRAVRALRRPKLGEEQAAKRLAFAQRYYQEPASFSYKWIFSDETTIARGEGERQAWVFCKPQDRLKPENVQPRGKPTRNSQMFWAGFSFNRRTSLTPLIGDPKAPRGGVSGRRIRECLEDNLPTIAEPGYTFAQDNASTHKAAIVQAWLGCWVEENEVSLVDWPAFSPDLNPIENAWKLLKEQVCKNHPELSDLPKNNDSKQRLCEAAVEACEELEDDTLNHLIESMPRRLKAVVEAKGWYTKY